MKLSRAALCILLLLQVVLGATSQVSAATNVYYSVGQSSTDLKTGTPTVTITSGAAVFSVSQTGNIGVGDRVTYNTSDIAYIAAKTNADKTQWTLVTATGAVPVDIAGSTVVSIKHEYTSLSAAVAGAKDANHLNSANLTASNVVLNIPCYYDSGADTSAVTVSGYTTGVNNYIRIYTPFNTATEANNSQRHQGKWDNSRYYLQITATAINSSANYLQIDGLQIFVVANNNDQNGIYASLSAAGEVKISNNIIKTNNNFRWGYYGITVYGSGNGHIFKIWNNVIYDFNFNTGVDKAIHLNKVWDKTGIYYVYNNTISNSKFGIFVSYGTTVAKNNIVQGCADGFYINSGSFDAASRNNISDLAGDAPGANSKNSTTVAFVDAVKRDFHLSTTDTAAIGSGVNLSADANLPFSTDIDGLPRTRWDIGADESATAVYYSVGQSAADLKTGTPTVTITSGAAVFSTAQTGNIGVGDRVTYNTSDIAYIAAKTNVDQMRWKLVTATGGVPANISGATVVSITREYTSLSAAVAGAGDANHLNTTNLVSGYYQLNFPCYYDSGADTSAVTVSGYTTGANNNIRIYTPSNTATEANFSQRHQGKWDDTKYKLVYTFNFNSALTIAIDHVTVEGLQVSVTSSGHSSHAGIKIANSATNNNVLSSLIIKGNLAGFENYGIWSYSKITLVNSVIYGFNAAVGDTAAIRISDPVTTVSILSNNTFYDCRYGVRTTWLGSFLAKNIITQNCTDGFSGSINAASNYNISDLAGDAPGANSKNSTTVAFVDAANKDFHISPSDSATRDSGTNLSADPNFAFKTDIDGQTRPMGAAWDIGADESPDTIAPSSTISAPANATIINSASPTPYTISGSASDNAAVSGIEVSTNNGGSWNAATCSGCPGASVTWTYSWALPADANYTIRSRANDSSANVESPAAGNTVTVDRTRPTVSSNAPANLASGVARNTSVTINWTKNIDCTTVNTSNITISGGGWALSSCSGNQAVFDTSGQFGGTGYTVTVTTAVMDLNANTMSSPYVFCYTTVAPAAVYYSVGQSSADLKSGAPTVTMSGGEALFSLAQTGNIGVGDRVTYNTGDIAYIAAKTGADKMHWRLVTASGTVPADIAGSAVVSIKHEYTSLSAAVAGASDASHINNADLTAANVVLNIPCYYDSGADTSAVTVSGYTTGANNYIKIYTPSNSSTEANYSQRHLGKWDDAKYALSNTDATPLAITMSGVVIDGFQVGAVRSTDGTTTAINPNSQSNGIVTISNSIIRSTGSQNAGGGISQGAAFNSPILKIFNNLIYGFNYTGFIGTAIRINFSGVTAYISNNTLKDGYYNIYGQAGTIVAKNNILTNATNAAASGTFAAGTDYNITDRNSIGYTVTGGANINDKVSQSVTFVDAANKDFHLSNSDTAARGAGVNLSTDPNLAFNTDIDGQLRPAGGAWDIGADQAFGSLKIKGGVKVKGGVLIKKY